jgi:hypothetical protein
VTIATTNTKKIYNGNGSTTVFAYDFLAVASSHLKVYTDTGSGLTLRTLTSDYTLSGIGNPAGGNVTFVTAPPAGSSNVVILREVPLTQLVDYIENDAFPAATHEGALDQLTMAIQQLQASIDRALLAPINAGASFALPLPAASTLLGWSADGLSLINTSPAAVGAGMIGTTELAAGAVTAAKLASTLVPGKETIWIPAGAWTPRTTNGAAAGSVELSTNKVMLKTLDFDQTTQEHAQFMIRMPKSWDFGTITAAFVWTANSTSTNGVTWGLQALALSNDETIDAAFGTGQVAADANTATVYQIHITGETNAITIGGVASQQDLVVLQTYRDVAHANDTLAADALLIGVCVFYTCTGANDA